MWFKIIFTVLVFSLLQPLTAAQSLIHDEKILVPAVVSQGDVKFQQDVEGSTTKWYKFAFDVLKGSKKTSYSTQIKLNSGKLINLFFEKIPQSPLMLTFQIRKPDEYGVMQTQFQMFKELDIDAAFLIAKAKTKEALEKAFWQFFERDQLGLLDY